MEANLSLNSKVDNLEATFKSTLENFKNTEGSKPQETGHKEQPKTESALDHYKGCTNCHKTINELAKKELEPEITSAALKVQREKVKSMKQPVICRGCGEIVERAEPKCPTCGSREARRF